ncbi:uncharacterized protein LOC100903420 [Galendromus occidentalis]|uniref:Uncharacterized protein LOC100903420 n=1 Tax=Galendromus occidentalis TaxID=34638 RepID=A0AAJ7WHQ0_9ACAR|nr:uncharacterized protein LOC100903420 [Galendromus occidentalis]
MVTCDNCGTEGQFRVVSGFYYCNVCDTQSQHAVEEEIEVAFDDGDKGPQGRVVGARAKRRGVSKRLRAYRRLNLLNDLLRKQVDDLLHLGAPPRFKVAVMELWFKYIHVLELDCEPYGKLPPYCLHEEYEMAIKRIEEESFSLKTATYNHIPMRAKTVKSQKAGNKSKERHPLYGYQAPKNIRLDPSGLSAVVSNLSAADQGRISPSASSVRSSSNATDVEASTTAGIEQHSGFGFGTQDTSLLESFQKCEDVKHFKEEAQDMGSFSFMGTHEDSIPTGGTSLHTPQDLEGNGEETFQASADISQQQVGPLIEEVDLTSEIAYKLRAHMAERDVDVIEYYVESVLQMHSHCLVMILYLGLIRANVYHIGAVDLYRFIRQKHLTYFDARESASDELLKARRRIFHAMFLPEILPVNITDGALLKSCAIICGLLDIPRLKMPDLNFFIARICLDLNLPRDFIAHATAYARRNCLQPTWEATGDTEFPFLRINALPHMEVEACAVIMVSLKYLFGIDGREEYKNSLGAELESCKGNQKYFVISRWLTQLSRRAHYLRRRGEFYNSTAIDFEHMKSAGYLLHREAKRRDDFYARGMNCRRVQRFLDDLNIPNRVHPIKLTPSSFPMKSTLEQLLRNDNAKDTLGLLEDMTDLKLFRGPSPRPYIKAAARQSKFYQKIPKPNPSSTALDGSTAAPSENLLILMQILGEYCLSSALKLHWALMRLERKIIGPGR